MVRCLVDNHPNRTNVTNATRTTNSENVKPTVVSIKHVNRNVYTVSKIFQNVNFVVDSTEHVLNLDSRHQRSTSII